MTYIYDSSQEFSELSIVIKLLGYFVKNIKHNTILGLANVHIFFLILAN